MHDGSSSMPIVSERERGGIYSGGEDFAACRFGWRRDGHGLDASRSLDSDVAGHAFAWAAGCRDLVHTPPTC